MPARRAAGAAARGSAVALSAGLWAARWALWLAAAVGGSAATAAVRACLRAAWTARVVCDLTLTLLAFLGFHSWRWGLLAGRLLAFAALLSPAWWTLIRWFACSGRVVRGARYGPHRRNDADVYVPEPGAVLCTCAAGDAAAAAQSHAAVPPCTCSPDRRPVVLCFCGGAWVIGYKFWPVALCRALSQAGVVAVAVDYRNFPQATLSGMVQDVDAALEAALQPVAPPPEDGGELAADADGLLEAPSAGKTAPAPQQPVTLRAALAAAGGDPSRVFVWGQSAGAHLAVATVIERAICDTLAAEAAAAGGAGGGSVKAYAIGSAFPMAAAAAVVTPTSATASVGDVLATPPRAGPGDSSSGSADFDEQQLLQQRLRDAAFSPPSFVPSTPASPALSAAFDRTPARRRGGSSSDSAVASASHLDGGAGGSALLPSPSHHRPRAGTRVRLARTASGDLTDAAALAYDSELGPLGTALLGTVALLGEGSDGADSGGDPPSFGGSVSHLEPGIAPVDHSRHFHTPRPQLQPALPLPRTAGGGGIFGALRSGGSPVHPHHQQQHSPPSAAKTASATMSTTDDADMNASPSSLADVGSDNRPTGSTMLARADGSSPARATLTPSRHHHLHHGRRASHTSTDTGSPLLYRGRLRSQADALAEEGAEVVAFPAGGAFAYAALPTDEEDDDGDCAANGAEAGDATAAVSAAGVADVTSASAPTTPSRHAMPLPPSPPPPAPPPPPHAIRRLFAVSGPYHLASVGAAIQAKAGFAPSFLETVFEGQPARFSPLLWLPACVRAAAAAGLAVPPPVVEPATDGSASTDTATTTAAYPPLNPARLPPVSLYHGTADTTVPHSSSVALAAALASAGIAPERRQLTLLPGRGHTDPILEGPLSGGDDPLLRGMLKAMRADLRHADDGAGGAATPRKQPLTHASSPAVASPALPPAATARLVPPLLVAAARWVNPF